MSASQPMPIAIVVIGRRFLGGVQSPDELWLMAECRSTVGPAPAARWGAARLAAMHDPELLERTAMAPADGALLTAAPQSLGITA